MSNQTLIPEDNVSSKQKKPISQETLKPENQHQLFKDSMGNSNAITTNNHFPMTPSFGNTHTKSKPSHPTQLNPFQSKKINQIRISIEMPIRNLNLKRNLKK